MSAKVEKDELNTPAIVTMGIVGALGLFVAIVALQAWFAKLQRDEYQRRMVAPKSEELAGVIADQQEQLNTYRWIDREKGVVAVPIERAMELVTREQEAAREAALAAPAASTRVAPKSAPPPRAPARGKKP